MKRRTPTSLLLAAALLGSALSPAALAQTAAPTTPTTTPATTTPATAGERAVESVTVNSAKGYTIKVPGGWIPIKNVPGADVAFVNRTINGLRPTITVVVQDVPADLKATLADFRDLYERNMPKEVPKFKLLGEKTVKVSGNPAILWTYTGDGEGGTVRWTQIFTLKNNRLFTVTLMTPTGTPADLLDPAREALNTFALTSK